MPGALDKPIKTEEETFDECIAKQRKIEEKEERLADLKEIQFATTQMIHSLSVYHKMACKKYAKDKDYLIFLTINNEEIGKLLGKMELNCIEVIAEIEMLQDEDNKDE